MGPDSPSDSTPTATDAPAPGHSQGRTSALRWIFPTFGSLTPLIDSPTTLGRDRSCTVVLPGTGVSRLHAEVWKKGPLHVVRDRGSKNGVFLNGRRIDEAPLSIGSVVRLGDWIAVVQSVDTTQLAFNSIQDMGDGLYVGPLLAARLHPAKAAASSNLSIIVEGQTGTGKERVARAIHGWSGRQGSFVAINCAAIPASLAEAELFGHRKGAFTGADQASLGHLRTAHGGTVLLDEITDLPLPIQGKLLRILQEREVVPVGESRPVGIDIRFIAATQVPLSTAARTQNFRPDLWARLNGLTVRLPTLRERIEEIPTLFLRMLADQGMSETSLTAEVAERLCMHAWPLNLRELCSLASRVAVIHPGELRLQPRHLVDLETIGNSAPPVHEDKPKSARFSRAFPLEQIHALSRAMAAHDHNLTEASAALGITRSKAYRLLAASQPTTTGRAVTTKGEVTGAQLRADRRR